MFWNRRGACVVVLLCLVSGLGQGSAMAADARAAAENAIREAEAAWSKIAGAKDVERFLSYYAEEASVLAPNSPIATGKEAIRGALAPLFDNPGFSLSWKVTKVEISRGADLGYSIGTYEMGLKDVEGTQQTDRGKYATVWKKQSDGSWKVVVDMFNTDLPAHAH
jgi:uncharacterized protein (TIGR02246 family)